MTDLVKTNRRGPLQVNRLGCNRMAKVAMQTADFHFDLPPDLIAQTPATRRDQSRLLVLHRASEKIEHRRFRDLLRWYEVRNLSAAPTIYQQGTYNPSTDNRWMASIAMDQAGDIGLGYSVSSSTVSPSIRYTGRLSGDPLGTMPQGEATMIAGSGSQTCGGTSGRRAAGCCPRPSPCCGGGSPPADRRTA